MRAIGLVGALLGLAPVPAAAVIQNVAFHGYGRVTYVNSGGAPEFPPPVPPVIGSPVKITGSLFIGGETLLPDDFTGNFQFDETALFLGQEAYGWWVAGGKAGGASGLVAYQGGTAWFVGGRLTAINVYVDYDGEIEVLGSSNWQAIYTRQDIDWGGTWALSVPEPTSWALMIAGFGLTGVRLRARAAAA